MVNKYYHGKRRKGLIDSKLYVIEHSRCLLATAIIASFRSDTTSRGASNLSQMSDDWA